MDESVNSSIHGDGVSNITAAMETDVRTLAMSYLMYKIGESCISSHRQNKM